VSFAVSITQAFLVAVFAVAGAAKLTNPAATRDAIAAFGAPPSLAVPGALVLPPSELLVAAALIPAATAHWAALVAVAMLVLFSAAMVRTLRAGSAPDCNCFGGLTQTEVGRGTLARNGLLIALAAFVAAGGQPVSALHWITAAAVGDRAVIAAMVGCIVALACFCWALLRQNGRLLSRLDEVVGKTATADPLPPPAPGTAAPSFSGVDLRGDPVTLEAMLSRGLPVVLFFTDPGCGACELVLDTVAQAQEDPAEKFTLVVVSVGSIDRIDRIERKATDFGLKRVLPQDDDALFDAYGVRGFPALVEIDADGLIAGAPALGADPVREALLALLDPVADDSGVALR
jgi:thiol-disulfide isomerase/thioredoxin